MKKALSMVLCLVLVLGLLAACGGTDGSGSGSGTGGSTSAGDSSGTGTAGEVDYSEHETFTYWLYSTPNSYYTTYSDNPVVQYLDDKFNVTLEFEQPATGTESDSLSLMFGTGEYTDAIDMSYYTGSISELYDDGVIVDLAPYLDYMPNMKALIDTDEEFRRAIYNDDGKILMLRSMHVQPELSWGGLVYRRDILDTMTGGNIAFPSGNEQPTTIEDWEYMLPLMKAYFEAAGLQESAALILPYNGYFVMGELACGFGVNTSYYLDGDTVKYGPMEQGFYNYLTKMREWYEAGYIYQDFASRTNDLFYLPNTSLTYGGAAGAWYGLSSQAGDVMSMPDYGLYMDVQPVAGPVDEANGQTIAYPFAAGTRIASTSGVAITSACENIPKLLSVLDYMYSEHGGLMRFYGLSVEDGAAENDIYIAAGLQEGTYWYEDGNFVPNPSTLDGTIGDDIAELYGVRLPGLNNNTNSEAIATEAAVLCNDAWRMYQNEGNLSGLPSSLARPTAEDKTFADNNVQLTDYLNTSVSKFIMGTEPLTEESFAAFVGQLKAYGIEENLRIQQEAYDRYLQR